jgi:hypothetical protein
MTNPTNLRKEIVEPRCAFCGETGHLHSSVDSFPHTWICSGCVHAFVEAEEVFDGPSAITREQHQ